MLRTMMILSCLLAVGWEQLSGTRYPLCADEQRAAPASRGIEDPTRQARLSSGETLTGKIAGIDPDGKITLELDDQRQQRLLPHELITWGVRAEPRRHSLLIMPAGQLVVSDWKLTADGIEIDEAGSWLLRANHLPAAVARGVILEIPSRRRDVDRLRDEILQAKREQDEFLLFTGDVLRGVWLESSDADRLRLKTTRALVPVARDRIQAIRCATPVRSQKIERLATQAILGFRDGSCLEVQKLEITDDAVQLRCSDNWELTADPASFWSELSFVQPLSTGIVYLSDVEPAAFHHTPFLTQSWQYGANRSVSGGTLRYRGRPISKGLGMHSDSTLEYQLTESDRRFQALIAVDDEAGTAGSVIFRVLIDRGDGQWSEAWKSPIQRGGDPARKVEVDVRGGKRLRLQIDRADRGDEWDHANWLDACLIRN
jgi:hypothetical protein